MPARGEHHHLRPEAGGIIEGADKDADTIRREHGFVVERRAAGGAKSLALVIPGIRRSQDFGVLAGDAHGRPRKHHDRGVPGTRIPLAVAALALEAADRLGGDFIMDSATGATPRIRHDANLPSSTATIARRDILNHIVKRIATTLLSNCRHNDPAAHEKQGSSPVVRGTY